MESSGFKTIWNVKVVLSVKTKLQASDLVFTKQCVTSRWLSLSLCAVSGQNFYRFYFRCPIWIQSVAKKIDLAALVVSIEWHHLSLNRKQTSCLRTKTFLCVGDELIVAVTGYATVAIEGLNYQTTLSSLHQQAVVKPQVRCNQLSWMIGETLDSPTEGMTRGLSDLLIFVEGISNHLRFSFSDWCAK